MTAYTSLSIRGACDVCALEHEIQLDQMEPKLANEYVRNMVNHGHFCPGLPETLEIPEPTALQEFTYRITDTDPDHWHAIKEGAKVYDKVTGEQVGTVGPARPIPGTEDEFVADFTILERPE